MKTEAQNLMYPDQLLQIIASYAMFFEALWFDDTHAIINVDHGDVLLDLPGIESVTEFGCNGMKLVRIPLELCDAVVSSEDALQITASMDADDFLLQCAR